MYDVLDELIKAECLLSKCSIEPNVRSNAYYLNRIRDIGSDLELLIDEISHNV